MKIAGSLLRRAGIPAALALLLGAVYALFFYRPPPPPAPALPVPNSYDDLVRAAGMVSLSERDLASLTERHACPGRTDVEPRSRGGTENAMEETLALGASVSPW